jgi:hypothetical protein
MFWPPMDIRRSLPEYRTREGDDVYNAPYRATQVDLNAFVLEASIEKLKALVDEQLNAVVKHEPLIGSQRHLSFDCTEGWIVVIFAAFRSLASVDTRDRSQGSVSAFEQSVWIPLLKRQQVEGAAIDHPAWFLPLVYTAPTASVAAGREVYGYPKVPAFLTLPDDGGPPVGVELRPSVARQQSDGQADRRQQPAPQRVFRVENAPSMDQVGWDPALLDEPMMRTVVGRFYANAPLIFRKQVGFLPKDGHAHAGYTALIESKVPITRLSNLELIEPSKSAGVVDVLSQQVADRLGIQNRSPLQGAAVRGCTLDIQQGSEIWVAAEPVPYVAPMPAPGNALMRGFEVAASVNAYDLEPNKPLSLSDDRDSLLHIGSAMAEVYRAEPRHRAISAILGRHFAGLPEDLRPVADKDRNFVVLQLLRATVRGAEEDVLLYELAVHVPVLFRDEPAWYVPYLFRSPGAAVIHAREWFGHPCQEAYILFRPDGKRTVSLSRPEATGDATRWVKNVAIEIDPVPAAREDDSPGQGFLDDLKQQRFVGLLQARHAADTSRACFQAIVSSNRTAEFYDPQPLQSRLRLKGALRLGRLLALDHNAAQLRGYRLANLILKSELPVCHQPKGQAAE